MEVTTTEDVLELNVSPVELVQDHVPAVIDDEPRVTVLVDPPPKVNVPTLIVLLLLSNVPVVIDSVPPVAVKLSSSFQEAPVPEKVTFPQVFPAVSTVC